MKTSSEVNFEKRGKLTDHQTCQICGACLCDKHTHHARLLKLFFVLLVLGSLRALAFGAEIPYTYQILGASGAAQDINIHGDIVLNDYPQPGGTILTKKKKSTAGVHFQCFDTIFDGTQIKKIDNQGNVAGNCGLDGTQHAKQVGFVREKLGGVIFVDVPGSDITQVKAINNGQIGGQYFNPFTNPLESGFERMHGFIRRQDGTFLTLDFPQLDTVTEISGVNRSRKRVGNVFSFDSITNETGNFIAFLEDNGLFSLLSVPGAQFSFALDINNNDDVLLDSTLGNYILSDGIYFKLPDPPATPGFVVLDVQVNGFNDELVTTGIYLERQASCVPSEFKFCPLTKRNFVGTPN